MTKEEFESKQDKILSTLPEQLRGPVRRLAWEWGHANGYSEVLLILNEIVDAVRQPVMDHVKEMVQAGIRMYDPGLAYHISLDEDEKTERHVMKTIWKYPIQPVDEQRIRMPAGAKLLHVAMQHDDPMLWALVDPDAPFVDRVVRIIGTGNLIECGLGGHVGTFLMGSFVWHVFDQGEV